MSKPLYIYAEWDEEAQVWVAVSDAVPGLAIESATTETLIERLKQLIPELLAANGVVHTAPVAFELMTRRFELTD